MVPWEPRGTRVSFQEPGCASMVPWEQRGTRVPLRRLSFHGTAGAPIMLPELASPCRSSYHDAQAPITRPQLRTPRPSSNGPARGPMAPPEPPRPAGGSSGGLGTWLSQRGRNSYRASQAPIAPPEPVPRGSPGSMRAQPGCPWFPGEPRGTG